MAFDFKRALEEDIVGQKRTGKNKPFVFFKDKFVIKGPYKSQKRFENVIIRSKIFEQWRTPCVVKSVDSFNTEEGNFIVFPNIMHKYKLDYFLYTETFSGLTYKVVKDPPVIDLGKALPENPWIFNILEDTILALCHCNILNVGDMNLRNILIDLKIKEIYIIDFDDDLTSDRDDEVFYFNKKPGKKLNWYSHVYTYYYNTAIKLKDLFDSAVIKNNNNLKNRLERAIELLMRYSKHSELIKELDVTETTKIETPKSTEKSIGKMVWKGLKRGSKTYSGIDLDIIKSAVQKYIRRSMTEKAILSAVEMYRLKEVGGSAAVTNLYNRLAIIANEDIGPSNLPLVLEVTQMVESDEIRDLETLITIVDLLSKSKKTRIMSHAWRTFCTPEGREIASEKGVVIDNDFTDSDLKFIEKNKNSSIFYDSDPEELRYYILTFLNRLIEKDFNAFSWVYYFIEYCKSNNIDKIKRRRKFIEKNKRSFTNKYDILIWRALSKVIPATTHDILVEAYYNHTENRPFLQHAIIIALYNLPYEKFNIEPYVQSWKKKGSEIQKMLNGEYSLEIDDFVIDKHTLQGKKMGKGIKEFVEEGSIVIPQDPKFYNKTLEEIYKIR